MLGDTQVGVDLGEARHQHFHAVGRSLSTSDVRGVGEAHDGDISAHWVISSSRKTLIVG
jgi:hypothetical protein